MSDDSDDPDEWFRVGGMSVTKQSAKFRLVDTRERFASLALLNKGRIRYRITELVEVPYGLVALPEKSFYSREDGLLVPRYSDLTLLSKCILLQKTCSELVEVPYGLLALPEKSFYSREDGLLVPRYSDLTSLSTPGIWNLGKQRTDFVPYRAYFLYRRSSGSTADGGKQQEALSSACIHRCPVYPQHN